jgi:hypothetical protein
MIFDPAADEGEHAQGVVAASGILDVDVAQTIVAVEFESPLAILGRVSRRCEDRIGRHGHIGDRRLGMKPADVLDIRGEPDVPLKLFDECVIAEPTGDGQRRRQDDRSRRGESRQRGLRRDPRVFRILGAQAEIGGQAGNDDSVAFQFETLHP